MECVHHQPPRLQKILTGSNRGGHWPQPSLFCGHRGFLHSCQHAMISWTDHLAGCFMISPFSWNRIKKEKRTRISCNHHLCKHDNTNVFVFPCSLTMLEPLNEWPAVLITSAWHSRSQLGQQLSYLWFPFKILHCKSANAVATFTTGCHSSLRTSYVFFVIFVFLWYFLYHFIPSFRLRHPATWLMIFLPVSPTMATEVPTSFSLRPLASPRRKVIL